MSWQPASDARCTYGSASPVTVLSSLFYVDEPGTLVVLRPAARRVRSERGARVLLLGGEPLDGPRQIFWSFLSSSKERIEQASRDWKARRFPLVPGDETDFVPLP